MAEISRQALLPYPASSVYVLVNDVRSYPEFVPGCTAVDVVSSTAEEVVAQVHAQARGFSEVFTTRNRLTPHSRIDLQLEDGPFDSLSGSWAFTQLGDAGCKVELQVSFEIGGVLGATLKPLMNKAADRVLDAFVVRARQTLS